MGVPEAAGFFAMTPREIRCALLARQARRNREWERSVVFARLVALAVHDPARLPAPPSAPLPEMTGEEMKRRLQAFCRKEEPHDPG